MKKITKLFLVIASIASLSFSSAFAGALSVTGSAAASYQVSSGNLGSQGIGVSNELNFGATGDMSGYTWTWKTSLDDATTVNDDTALTLAGPIGTVGAFISNGGLSSKLGFGIGALGTGYDFNDAGALAGGTGANLQGVNIDSYNNVQYHTPAEILPFGITAKIGHAPNLSSVQGASYKDKGAVEPRTVGKSATTYRIDAAPIAGLTLGASYADTDGANNAVAHKQESGDAYIKYVTGPIAIGLSQVRVQPNTLKATATGRTDYKTNHYGVQFAVNDALSVSYSEERAKRHTSSTIAGNGTRTTTADVTIKQKHYQIAYVIGGATLGIAVADAKNAAYTSNAKAQNTIFSLAMAF